MVKVRDKLFSEFLGEKIDRNWFDRRAIYITSQTGFLFGKENV